jgi:excisionase family DNA binding protein
LLALDTTQEPAKGFFMDMQKYLTPPAVGKMLGVNADKVVAWIRAGKLRASNVSDKTRPRWRIAPSDLQDYLAARSNQAKQSATKRTRRTIPKPSKQWV